MGTPFGSPLFAIATVEVIYGHDDTFPRELQSSNSVSSLFVFVERRIMALRFRGARIFFRGIPSRISVPLSLCVAEHMSMPSAFANSYHCLCSAVCHCRKRVIVFRVMPSQIVCQGLLFCWTRVNSFIFLRISCHLPCALLNAGPLLYAPQNPSYSR